MTARFAGALRTLGLQPGERLMMLVDKSPEAILLYLTALRMGAILVPLNTAYTTREFQYFLANATPKVVVLRPIVDLEKQRIAVASGCQVTTLDSKNEGSFPELVMDVAPADHVHIVEKDDIAALLYTSGTTGKPKGAMLSHGILASNGLVLHEAWGFQKEDVLLHALPVFHVHGLFVAVHCAILNGSPMLFLPKFDAQEVVELLEQATIMMGVPTFYTRLLEHPSFSSLSCKNMRLFISGSAPLLRQTWQAFYKKTGHKILERYGMSEAGMITSNPLKGNRIPGTVGFPLRDINVRISDQNGNPLPAGHTGILEVKGPNVFSGYWVKTERTSTHFRNDGFFISGDLANMTGNGRITIIGRGQDLVITGGLNVYPKEVEDCLNQLPGIQESAVIGIPHPDFGEALVAIITSENGTLIEEQNIITALKQDLASFKVPRRIIRVPNLPKNVMGKVQKNILRKNYASSLKDR